LGSTVTEDVSICAIRSHTRSATPSASIIRMARGAIMGYRYEERFRGCSGRRAGRHGALWSARNTEVAHGTIRVAQDPARAASARPLSRQLGTSAQEFTFSLSLTQQLGSFTMAAASF
jgi:hypothetical protein